ncbi:hypothetical protein [Muriicola soli]|uniref:Uncharacterized protein n=1 Tax=Muriicola soli TaxID=2507538 RepID=A0A411E7K8_9FLAO|nr:hypothetical protein [Muriicola soli]QBA63669.1 hypothetical protein EQY75_03370 [Muriicola soli]
MKRIYLLLLVIIFLYSCEKDSSSTTNIQRIEGSAISFKKNAIVGGKGGATSYNKASSLQNKNVDSTFFISQFPLVEYRYIQEITFDSIPIYEINQDTQDTLNITYEVNEVSRDTVGFEKGKLWLPLDDRNFSKVYIGISEEQLAVAEFYIGVQMIDSIPVEGNGLLFKALYEYGDVESNGEQISITGDSHPFDSRYYRITNEIPVFNEFGEIVEYKYGIELGSFLLRNFQIGETQELTRSFRLIIASQPDVLPTPEDPSGTEPTNNFKIYSDFDIKFIVKEIWNDRQCWLSGTPECQDLF